MATRSRFPIGISTFVMNQEPLPAVLEQISAAGVSRIELWGESFHGDPRRLAIPADQIAALLNDKGIAADSVHAPFVGLNPGDADPPRRAEVLSVAKSAVDLCSRIGAGIMVVHPVSARPGIVPSPRESLAAAADTIAELARYAEGRGVRLAIENMPHADWLGSSISQLVELVDRIGAPNVGFCLDTGHALINGFSPADEARAAGSRLIALHISDNDGAGDQHLNPGLGRIDWPPFLNALDEIDYQGDFTLELMPGQQIQTAVATTRQWLAL